MKRRATLALGVDVGSARTRVALVERDAAGRPRLVAVAARATGDDASWRIREARAPNWATANAAACSRSPCRTRCFRNGAFPTMGESERRRAARFEAARFVPYPLDEAHGPRCHRRRALHGRGRTAKPRSTRGSAPPKTPVCVRSRSTTPPSPCCARFPHADAIIDIGDGATTLVVADDPLPATRSVGAGGRAFTAAVVASLGIDEAAAEARKRSVGLAGAGEYARATFVEQIASALIEHRANGHDVLRAIAVTGNGARLAGLAEALERALAIPVRLATLGTDTSDALPDDVVRAASPDWGLAYGLALWETAA